MHRTDKKPITLLAVDDSPQVLRMLTFALETEAVRLLTAESGEEALDLLAEVGLPDLATVDLTMPGGMDGFEFCKRLHRWSDVPVIMLTGVDEQGTVVRAIEQHAEDYVTKPFIPEVLEARINRVLDRVGTFPYPTAMPIRVDGCLRVDFPGRTVYLGEERNSLTPTESRLLYILMRATVETVPSDFLLRRMWPREVVYEDRLHVYVHRLREKLHRPEDEHEYIQSERGVGYRFQPRPAGGETA